MSQKKTKLKSRAKKYLAALALGKRSYELADDLLAEICESMKPGDEIPMGPDRPNLVLVDKFVTAKKNLIWAHAAARRYALEEAKPQPKLSVT